MRQTACVRRSLAGMIGGGTRGRETMPGMRRREFRPNVTGSKAAVLGIALAQRAHAPTGARGSILRHPSRSRCPRALNVLPVPQRVILV